MCEARPFRFAFLYAVLLVLVRPASAWAAGPFPVGPEFQINTYTTSFQNYPSVAVDGSGNFVIVWQSFGSSGLDSDHLSVQGQRFDSAGIALGTEFLINTYTTSAQRTPNVAVGGSGNFVVVWSSYGSSGSDSSFGSVQGRRFDGTGTPLGIEFQINTYTTSFQTAPRVAADGSGNFVVVWTSNGSSGSDSSSYSVHGQRFASTGAPLGTEFQVNTYTTSSQTLPSVAVDGAGNFMVVWQSIGSSGSDSSFDSIQGQRFSSTGAPLGAEFQINTYTTSAQRFANVAVDGAGNFVVVWESYGSSGSDSSDSSIQSQRFGSTGVPLGTEFQVNAYTTSFQRDVSVAADGSGNFVVAWSSYGSSGSDSIHASVQGQRFDSAGAPLGTEFQINTYTTSFQGTPSVAASGSGDIVVAWGSDGSSGSDNSNLESVQGQRFTTATLCGAAPEPDGSCRLADVGGAGKSSIQIKNDTDDSKDQFKWKWNKGVATDVGDFKTPTAGTATYRLCVYDDSGATQPLLEWAIPSGGPMWSAAATGFKYKSPASRAITQVKLKAGASGKAQVQVKGKGSLLAPPATAGLLPDVVVQLLIDDGITIECFKTAFPGSSGMGAVTKQDATQFKAKGP